jgi:hypothetical protein
MFDETLPPVVVTFTALVVVVPVSVIMPAGALQVIFVSLTTARFVQARLLGPIVTAVIVASDVPLITIANPPAAAMFVPFVILVIVGAAGMFAVAV